MTTIRSSLFRILSVALANAFVLGVFALGIPGLEAAAPESGLSAVELSAMHSRLVLPEPATVLASSMAALVIVTHYTLRRKQARKQEEA
ncbi:MAG: hypothetical protein JW706_03990 [Opitutales bacterium]|nr:hypothetical protein [Opitutales bacterium]